MWQPSSHCFLERPIRHTDPPMIISQWGNAALEGWRICNHSSISGQFIYYLYPVVISFLACDTSTCRCKNNNNPTLLTIPLKKRQGKLYTHTENKHCQTEGDHEFILTCNFSIFVRVYSNMHLSTRCLKTFRQRKAFLLVYAERIN